MNHIEQLKKIRAEAIARLHNSEDFKLAGKLGLLIEELGESVDDASALDNLRKPELSLPKVGDTKAAAPGIFQSSFGKPKSDDLSDITGDNLLSDTSIDDLVAEIEGDAAELDALMAESDDVDETKKSPSFIKPEETRPVYSNGATH